MFAASNKSILPYCTRLHFFAIDFDEAGLRGAINDVNSALVKELQTGDVYLGFVVAKPLPWTFIGRTCLKTYDEGTPQRRFFPVKRKYPVHLLGLDLSVESLPYQEQDTVAAACATSALWSTFQSTARLFQHEIRSPIEITRIATEHSPSPQRDVPNRGLTLAQMAAAIKAAGLEPEVTGVGQADELRAKAYAYLRAQIPLLMNTTLYDVSDLQNPIPYRGNWNSHHAVAITGYSLGDSAPTAFPNTEMLVRSSRINKFYVHDDGIGPFARLEFGTPEILVSYDGKKKKILTTLKSSWRGGFHGEEAPGTVWFGPWALIVPLYHKIRIRFDTILEFVVDFDRRHRKLAASKGLPLALEWDIYLATGGEIKSEIRIASDLSPEQRWRVLERPMPRFVWRATAYDGESRFIDLLYDATDIDQGDFLIHQLTYDAHAESH